MLFCNENLFLSANFKIDDKPIQFRLRYAMANKIIMHLRLNSTTTRIFNLKCVSIELTKPNLSLKYLFSEDDDPVVQKIPVYIANNLDAYLLQVRFHFFW